ncbi:MAG: caspase family protein [Phycisphaerae bacterium]|nr:caspase family protein [Phycisphaerae bacterium]
MAVARDAGDFDPRRRVLVIFVADEPPNPFLVIFQNAELFYAATQVHVTVLIGRDKLEILHKNDYRRFDLRSYWAITPRLTWAYVDADRHALYNHFTGDYWFKHRAVIADINLAPIASDKEWAGIPDGRIAMLRQHLPFNRELYEKYEAETVMSQARESLRNSQVAREEQASGTSPSAPGQPNDIAPNERRSGRGLVPRKYNTTSVHRFRAGYQNVHFVAIGINRYLRPHPSLPPLRCAEPDATAISSAVAALGWKQVALLLGRDATEQAIKVATRRLADAAGPDDAALVFFAGHGTSVPTAQGGQLFLVPADGDWDNLRNTAVGIPELLGTLNSTRAKHVLLLLDCCAAGYTAAIPRGGQAGSSTDYDQLMKTPARIALLAATADQSALEPVHQEHSYFAQALLDVIRDDVAEPWARDRIFTSHELASYIQRHVSGKSHGRQTPSLLQLPGHKGGDFVFDLRSRVGPAHRSNQQ